MRHPSTYHLARDACLCSALLLGCGADLSARRSALERVLAAERSAHLELDAEALASLVADSLVSVADGVISKQSRDNVRAMFRAYFEGASYSAWDDLEPPRVAIASDGRSARVHRRVTVERTEPAFGVARRTTRFESAWTATYDWSESRWQMTSVTSTSPATRSAAEVIVDAARRRVGVSAIASDSMLRAVADVQGPTGDFRVVVHSGGDGSARIDFDTGLAVSAFRGGGWTRMGSQVSDSLPSEMLTFLRGHEVHLMLLAPMSRLGELRYGGRATFEGVPALRLEGQDALGSQIELFYALPDTVPMGFEVTDHMNRGAERVSVSTAGWGGGTGAEALAATVTFRQGSDEFRYRYSERQWLPLEAALFRDPSRVPGG